jgi:hypothetical protein
MHCKMVGSGAIVTSWHTLNIGTDIIKKNWHTQTSKYKLVALEHGYFQNYGANRPQKLLAGSF